MNPYAVFRLRLFCAMSLAALPGCASAVLSPDANAADQSAPTSDATATMDSTPPGVDVVVGADVAVVDTVVPDVPMTMTCSARLSTQCMTPEAAIRNVQFPPGLFPQVDGGRPIPDGAVLPNGCVAPSFVQSGCCNPAQALEVQGTMCCYTFCDQACCGRPLLVDGVARVAALTSNNDWSDISHEIAMPMNDALRVALADAWTRDGLFEHASIASFAKLSLELLSFAAPPALVSEAQQAGLDEVEHARACFSLASNFSSGPIGPGKLPVTDLRLHTSLREFAIATVLEGCIGETASAMLVAEQARRAVGSTLKKTLETIAEQEATHAEFSWRLLLWALQKDPSLVDPTLSLLGQFTRDTSKFPRPSFPELADWTAWEAHGRLSPSTTETVLQAFRTEVLLPAVDFLQINVRPQHRSAALH